MFGTIVRARVKWRRLGFVAVTRELPHLDGVAHRFVDAGGLRVHVAEAGEGEPLVLLHGWPQNWWAWRKLIPPLAERYRVICPDLRGHGWTEAPPGGYEKKGLAGDLLALLDALELERVRLVGHDWGGFAGFLACVRAPERFERFLALNIIHPWYRGRPTPRAVVATIAYQGPIITPLLGTTLLRRVPLFIRTIMRLGSERRDVWTDADLAIFTDQFREPERARATVSVYRAFQFRELPALLTGRYETGRLRTPTLLLVGVGDAVVRVKGLDGWEEHADDMLVESLPGCGHFPAEERPDAVLERALPFFEARPGGPRPGRDGATTGAARATAPEPPPAPRH